MKQYLEYTDEKSNKFWKGILLLYGKIGSDGQTRRFFNENHFGGTIVPEQSEPDNLGLFYFEFTENLGGANLGGGVAQINLKENTLEWACG